MSNRAFENEQRQDFTPNEIYSFDPETDAFVKGPSLIVSRHPLPHTRQVGSEVNIKRLPSLSQRANMELAFREEPLTETAVKKYADKWLLTLLVVTSVVAIVFGLGLPFIKPVLMPYGMAIAAFIGILTLGPFFATKRMTIPLFVTLLFVPSLATATFYFICLGLEYRLVSSIFLGALSLCLLFKIGHQVLNFYDQWLLCEPRLRPETRANQRGHTLGIPDFTIALTTITVAIGVTWISPLAAVVSVLLLSFGTVLFRGAMPNANSFAAILNQGRHLIGHYLTYGRISSGAAGVWLPTQSMHTRIIYLLVLCFVVAAFFSVALQGFFPWDTPGVFYSDFINESSGYQDMRKPHAWVGMTMHLINNGKLHLIWAFPISFVLSFLVPTSFFVAVFYGCISKSLDRRKVVESQLDVDGRTEWQWYVDRIRKSKHVATDPVLGNKILERDHLFLGVQPNIHYPVLLDKKILSEHAYIVGESGSGKTSLGIMPMLLQLIRGNSDTQPKIEQEKKDYIPLICPSCSARCKVRTKYKHPTAPCPKCQAPIPVTKPQIKMHDSSDESPPIVIIDLKGDPALFHTMRMEAEARQPGSFRWFTPEPGFSSHYFNPFLGFDEENRSLIQVAELLIDALGLSHGEGYGRSYFTRQNRVAILDALRREPQPRSFEDLANNIVEIARQNPGNYKDIGELLATLRVLTEYEQIAFFKPLQKPEHSIHMPSVLENRQTVYFWLPAALESVSVREIGKLALYALLSAAIDRQRQGKEVIQTYLFIDEFQRIAGENFKVILEQARSFGIGVILANQTASDLKTSSADLRPTVRTNTRAKMIFSLSDPQEVGDVTSNSGEELQVLHSLSRLPFSGDASDVHPSMPSPTSGVRSSRISQDDILSVNDHPLDFIFQVSRGSGYTQFGGLPVRVRSNWALPLETYMHRMRNEQWPTFDANEITAECGMTSEDSPEELDRRREACSSEFEEILHGMFNSYDQPTGNRSATEETAV
ncbi:MAG: hypothetical protein AAGA30_02985 [Planctomycetota bacterium]